MTIGMIFGAIIEYSNAMQEAQEGSGESGENIVTRKATADDYIAF